MRIDIYGERSSDVEQRDRSLLDIGVLLVRRSKIHKFSLMIHDFGTALISYKCVRDGVDIDRNNVWHRWRPRCLSY